MPKHEVLITYKENWFKRHPIFTFFFIVIIIGIVLGIIGGINSSNGNNKGELKKTNNSAEISVEQLNVKVGEIINSSKLEVSIINATVTKEYFYKSEYFQEWPNQAESGKVFVLANALVKNIGEDEKYIFSNDFSMTDSENYKYDPVIYFGNNGFDSQNLYPGQKTGGIILFEVPETSIGLKILYNFADFFGSTKIGSWSMS